MCKITIKNTFHQKKIHLFHVFYAYFSDLFRFFKRKNAHLFQKEDNLLDEFLFLSPTTIGIFSSPTNGRTWGWLPQKPCRTMPRAGTLRRLWWARCSTHHTRNRANGGGRSLCLGHIPAKVSLVRNGLTDGGRTPKTVPTKSEWRRCRRRAHSRWRRPAQPILQLPQWQRPWCRVGKDVQSWGEASEISKPKTPDVPTSNDAVQPLPQRRGGWKRRVETRRDIIHLVRSFWYFWQWRCKDSDNILNLQGKTGEN